jgi:hypothetical protein
MKLTEGMFSGKTPNDLGLYPGNRRQYEKLVVKDNKWFNHDAQRIGDGDLNREDIEKLSRLIDKGEVFITLTQQASADYAFSDPDMTYLIENAHLVIVRGHYYFVSNKREFPGEMKEACFTRLPILLRTELAELLKKSEQKRAHDLWQKMSANARKYCHSRSISKELAFLYVFAHLADKRPGDVFQYSSEEKQLMQSGICTEMGIDPAALNTKETRERLVSEAKKLISASRTEPDPITALIMWEKIDAIARTLELTLRDLGSSMSEQDDIWLKAYGQLRNRPLSDLVAEYEFRAKQEAQMKC